MDFVFGISKEEEKSYCNAKSLILTDSPFIITPEELDYIDLDKYDILPYFKNRNNGTKNNNDIIRFMPFTILLNRLSIDNKKELYEKIVYYVYTQARHHWHDKHLFRDIMFDDRVEKFPRSLEQKMQGDYLYFIKSCSNEDRYPLDVCDSYTYYRDDYEYKEVLYMHKETIKFLHHTGLIIPYYKLIKWQCSDQLCSWYLQNFSSYGMPFYIIYNRLYKDEKYKWLNELIKKVEDSILDINNKKYISMYLLLSRELEFYGDDEKVTCDTTTMLRRLKTNYASLIET